MNTSSPASFWPPCDDAELGGLLDRVDRVAAGVGEADDLGARGLRLQQEGGEVGGRERVRCTEPTHLAAGSSTTAWCRRSQGMAEGVVGGEEEPGVAAALDDRLAGAVGQRVGVVGPVDGGRRAGSLGQIGRGRAGDDGRPCSSPRRPPGPPARPTRSARRRSRRPRPASIHSRAMVEPTSGLFWWSAETISIGLPFTLPPKSSTAIWAAIDRARPGEVGVEPDMSFSTPILTHAVGDLRRCRAAASASSAAQRVTFSVPHRLSSL